jgi:hypothetical protein
LFLINFFEMPGGVHTRNTVFSHLTSLVGTGKELTPSELPTTRDLLRLGIFYRETSYEDKRNYSVDDLVGDIIAQLLAQWKKANAQFKYPVIIHEETLKIKIKKIWERGNIVSRGRTKLEEKTKFISKLDHLFDILYCKCPIKLCAELGCQKIGEDRCKKDAHANCNCLREFKIPQLELSFVRAQREKEGSEGALQIGGVDTPESKRQDKAIKNKVKKKTNSEAAETKRAVQSEGARRLEVVACEFMAGIDEDSDDDEEDMHSDPQISGTGTADRIEVEAMEMTGTTEFDLQENDEEGNLVHQPPQMPTTGAVPKKSYNRKNIPNIALASIRHHTGLRETAEIATAAWIDAGIIDEHDTSLVIDHNKVKRAQLNLAKELEKEFDENIRKNGVSCLLFDGRKDSTKVMLEAEGSERQFPGLIKEEHYSVCKEPGGNYLFHFVPRETTETQKHAELLAEDIVNWLIEKKCEGTLAAIGGDSTSVNTGWEGGAMHWVERKLNKNLVWIVCDLHTGELPLRKLFTELDGPTLSGNKYSGDIGKLLDSATELEINPNFEKVAIGPPLIELTDKVIKDLSTDQAYAYKITNAIRSGVLSNMLALLEIGPICESRWLTKACRLSRIWVSKHGLSKKNVQNLRHIMEFVIGVYMPNWFNIKVKHSWVEGPRHVLYQLELLRFQKKKVVDIVKPTVQRGAWYAHSESVLQAMLCSEVAEERKFAVDKIVNIRGHGEDDTQVGDNSVRYRITPDINWKSTKLADLIKWKENVTEPALTCHLTTTQVKQFVVKPMIVPDWPSHTQSVERLVKKVTEAAGHVYSHARRDAYIRGQEVSAELMSSNRSKQDMVGMVRFRKASNI